MRRASILFSVFAFCAAGLIAQDAADLPKYQAWMKAAAGANGALRAAVTAKDAEKQAAYFLAKALPQFDRLMMLALGGSLYRYRSVDVAFVVRAPNGHLFTPVIRSADAQAVDAIAAKAQVLSMGILRGRAKAEDLQGAAFTISQVSVPGTTRVVALPSFGQSAILGVSAERTSVAIDDSGAVRAVPTVTLTLNYDHALCDGMYAAGFLAAVVTRLESLAAFRLPDEAPYEQMRSLSIEARSKLARRRPVTLAQAASIPGVSPADLQNLVLEVQRLRVSEPVARD